MECNDAFRSVCEIPEPYRAIFADYRCFNAVQSKVLDEVLHTNNSMVVAAPTGSGKTVIFELAIVRFLLDQGIENSNKVVYLSPLKALCEERLIDWQRKFSQFNLNCVSINGDTENIDFNKLVNFHIIIATPEKWDVLTRKWRSNQKVVGLVKLFLIDEVHLLNTDVRGSTLEVTVCRMKSIDMLLNRNEETNGKKIRFLALSATVPNVDDVAEWIGQSKSTKYYHFPEEMRPVKLNKVVLGYPFNAKAQSAFKFDYSLNYKLQHLMLQYSKGKPILIFCSTRKSVEMTVDFIVQNVKINLNLEQKQVLEEISMQIGTEKMRSHIRHGVGFHHAGLSFESRHIIQEFFRCGHLPILVTTSTLAMGVNLPAHLVIIKSTKAYDNGWRDYTETEIFQMIGRAGRPQFDTSATAVILTTKQDKEKYVHMIGSGIKIESNLHRHFTEHLNAEVVLGTINHMDIAMQWLTSTFLYIRARKNPAHYNLPNGLSADQIDRKLLDMCHIDLNKLVSGGMLEMNENIEIFPTDIGRIMAKYYVSFETMKLFSKMTGKEILLQILEIISKCGEFSDIRLRVADKKLLNLFNKNSNKETIRFPLNGKIKSADMKVNCIIQSVLGNLEIGGSDNSLINDSQNIMKHCSRVVKCLIEYLQTRTDCYTALLNSVILAKCFEAKLWENSPYMSKQLNGIGHVLSHLLAKAKKRNFQQIAESNPRQIEMIVRRKPPLGTNILEEIKHLPEYDMKLEYLPGLRTVTVSITLKNVSTLVEKSRININSYMVLLVGDDENKILVYERYSHSYMTENPRVVKVLEIESNYQGRIHADFISENWVGIDCTSKVSIENHCSEPATAVEQTPQKTSRKNYMQTFLDTFLQHTSKNHNNKEEAVKNKENSDPNTRIVKKTVSATPMKKKVNKSFTVSNNIYGKEVKRKMDERKNEGKHLKTAIRQDCDISETNISKKKNQFNMNDSKLLKPNKLYQNIIIEEPKVSVRDQNHNGSSEDIFESFSQFLQAENRNQKGSLIPNGILTVESMRQSPFLNKTHNMKVNDLTKVAAENLILSPVLNKTHDLKVQAHDLTKLVTDKIPDIYTKNYVCDEENTSENEMRACRINNNKSTPLENSLLAIESNPEKGQFNSTNTDENELQTITVKEAIKNKENSDPNTRIVKNTVNATPKKKKVNKSFTVSNNLLLYGKVVKRKMDERKNEGKHLKNATRQDCDSSETYISNKKNQFIINDPKLLKPKKFHENIILQEPKVSVSDQGHNGSSEDIFKSFSEFLQTENRNPKSSLIPNETLNLNAESMRQSPALNKTHNLKVNEVTKVTAVNMKLSPVLNKSHDLKVQAQNLTKLITDEVPDINTENYVCHEGNTSENVPVIMSTGGINNNNTKPLEKSLLVIESNSEKGHFSSINTDENELQTEICENFHKPLTKNNLPNISTNYIYLRQQEAFDQLESATKEEDMPKSKDYVPDSTNSKTFSYRIKEVLVPNKKTKFNDDTSPGSGSSSIHNKGISWRSPLIHSPGIKFSPKIWARNVAEKRQFRDSIDEKTNDTLESSDTSTGCTVNLTLNVKDTPKQIQSPWRSVKKIRKLPLCDRSFEKSSEDFNARKSSFDDSSSKLLGFYSLENEPNTSKNVDNGNSSVSDYYSQLLTQRYADRESSNNDKCQYLSNSKNDGPNPVLNFSSPTARNGYSQQDDMRNSSVICNSQALRKNSVCRNDSISAHPEVINENLYNSRTSTCYDDVNGLTQKNSVQRYPLQSNSQDCRIPSAVPNMFNIQGNVGFPYQNTMINPICDTNDNKYLSQSYKQTFPSSEELDRYLQDLDQSELNSGSKYFTNQLRPYQNPPNLLYANAFLNRVALNQMEYLDHPNVPENRLNQSQMWLPQHSRITPGLSSYSPMTAPVPIVTPKNQLPMSQWGYYNNLPYSYPGVHPNMCLMYPPNQMRHGENIGFNNNMLVSNQENFSLPKSNNYQTNLNQNSCNMERGGFVKPSSSTTTSELNNSNHFKKRTMNSDLHDLRDQSSSQNTYSKDQTGRNANQFSQSFFAEDYYKNKKELVLHEDSFDDRLNEMTSNSNRVADQRSSPDSQFIQNRTQGYFPDCNRFDANQNNTNLLFRHREPRQQCFPVTRHLGSGNHVPPRPRGLDERFATQTQRYFTQDY